jgi:hypothetical protein
LKQFYRDSKALAASSASSASKTKQNICNDAPSASPASKTKQNSYNDAAQAAQASQACQSFPSLNINCFSCQSCGAKTVASFPSFIKFHKSLPKYYPKPVEVMFTLYCEGNSIRQISKEMRRLYKNNKLPKLQKSRHKNSKRLPYSIYWVHTQLKQLKIDTILFNKEHPEGINLWDQESQTDEDLINSELGWQSWKS